MDGKVIIGTEIDDSDFEDGIEEMENKADKGGSKVGGAFSRVFSKATSFGKGFLNVVGRIAKSILDITSVAGLIGTILGGATLGALTLRGALQKVFQENEQVKANIQYIVFAINKALEPAINKVAEIIVKIINLILKAMQYTAYLIKMWTGKNIFDGANADAFSKSMQEGAKDSKKIAKNMKEAGKQTAKFDEMNILQDNSSGGGGADIGAGGGIGAMPTIDLSNLEDVEIPKWLEWIAKNGELIKTIIIGIGIAIASLKLAEFLQTLGLFSSLPLWQLTAGLGLILAGLILTIQGVIDFIKDPSWENFLTILQGISLVVAGIAVLMGGWVVALIALGVAIVANVIQNWDKVKAILGVVGDWLYNTLVVQALNLLSIIWNAILKASEDATNLIRGAIELIWKAISSTSEGATNLVRGTIEGIANLFRFLKDLMILMMKQAFDGIKNVFSSIGSFFSNIISKIMGMFKTIGTSAGNVIGNAFKSVVNGVLGAIESILNTPIKTINSLIGTINKVPGINLGKLSTFKLPRLAKGGIVNMPGRGINYGGANVGEGGPEGVIPFTDDQVMDRLGQAIARHMVINANITNTMNGRVISRELQKINNENDFAFNR